MHCCLDVRGSLKTMSKRQLTGLFRHADGTKCTADEAKDHLLEALAQARRCCRSVRPAKVSTLPAAAAQDTTTRQRL
jgi:hypothetical protein